MSEELEEPRPPVVVAGPEGSGTHLLAALVEQLGLPVLHRSLPHAGSWWIGPVPTDEPPAWYWVDPETGVEYPAGSRFVVITRRPDVTTLALLARKPALAESIDVARAQWHRALGLLALLPDAWWISYEALLRAPERQVGNLAAWLGVEPVSPLLEVRDENRKWLSVLER